MRSPIITKPVSRSISNGSRPLKRGGRAAPGRVWGTDPGQVRDRRDVVGRRPAAAADDVDQPGGGELAEVAAGVGRQLVVLAEGVRQAGIRMARDVGVGDACEVLDVRAHLLRAERAVHADDQRLGVLDRRPERLDRLAREVAAARVDRREGDPPRQLGRDVERRGDRRLRVQRVEDRLEHQQVDPAVAERRDLLGVRLVDLVERHRAEARVVDLRGHGERDVQRAERAGDEAADLVGRLPREPRALEAHLGGDVLERVVGLADPGGGEGVGGRDVGAGGEVAPVDVEDHLRPRQVEQVGVARDVARVVAEALAAVRLLPADVPLDQDAPRSVEQDDPLVEQSLEMFDPVGHRAPLPKESTDRCARGSLGVC